MAFDPLALQKIGPYVVVRALRQGGFAWVYEVEDPRFEGRHLALKLLKLDVATPETVHRFLAEAALLAKLDHPNLLTVFDHGEDPGTGLFYYVMALADGGALDALVHTEGPRTTEQIGEIFMPILSALRAMHGSRPQVIHRDVKPSNVLLGSSGHAYLGDLGIAREEGGDRTRTGALLGSVSYMSPEQVRGRAIDARTDLFSLALTLYFAATGASAYDAIDDVGSTTEGEVLGYLGHLARTGEEIDFVFPSAIPVALQDVIRKGARIDPTERYASAAEMQEALRAAIYGSPAGTAPSRGEPVWRDRRVQLGAALGAVVIAGGLGLRAILGSPSPEGELARVTRQAEELVVGAFELTPPPSSELAGMLERALARGRQEAEEAREDAGAGMDATASQLRAIAAFREACAALDARLLAPRVSDRIARMRERAGEFGVRGAPDALPAAARASWDRADASLEDLSRSADAGDACEIAVSRRAALDRTAAVALVLDEVDEALAQASLDREAAPVGAGPTRPDAVVAAVDPAGDARAQMALGASGDPDGSSAGSEAGGASESPADSDPDPARGREPIRNRPPELVVSPSGNPKGPETARHVFRARASDPDGDDVDVTFVFEGKRTRANEFTVPRRPPGEYVLAIEASDGEATARAERRITVFGAARACDAGDVECAARAALARYETYMQSCDRAAMYELAGGLERAALDVECESGPPRYSLVIDEKSAKVLSDRTVEIAYDELRDGVKSRREATIDPSGDAVRIVRIREVLE